MTRYLLDTNILIDLIKSSVKNSSDNKEHFVKSLEGLLVVPHIAAGELIQGARDKKELKIIGKFLDTFVIDWGGRHVLRLSQEILVKHALKTPPCDGVLYFFSNHFHKTYTPKGREV